MDFIYKILKLAVFSYFALIGVMVLLIIFANVTLRMIS